MNQTFDRVALIGVGLLGGSLGLALKERRLAGHVVGVGHRQSSLDKALAIGAIDEASLNAAEAVRGANLVVLCTPAAKVPEFLDAIAPSCTASAVVTDVASTKALICAHAKATWPHPLRFVGSHPMAGSEKFGPEHSRADLYEGAVTFVERDGDLDAGARQGVVALWESVGSRVVDVDPELHDAIIARTSQIPHIVSSALAQLAAQGDTAPPGTAPPGTAPPGIVRPFVGKGFRDTTRIAEGRAEIWRDISLTNPQAIQAGLDDLIQRLQDASDAVKRKDSGWLDAFFERGSEARRKVLDE